MKEAEREGEGKAGNKADEAKRKSTCIINTVENIVP